MYQGKQIKYFMKRHCLLPLGQNTWVGDVMFVRNGQYFMFISFRVCKYAHKNTQKLRCKVKFITNT